MQILDAYAEAMGLPTLSAMVSDHFNRKQVNAFKPVIPVNESAAIERNRLKWAKKAEKAKKLIKGE